MMPLGNIILGDHHHMCGSLMTKNIIIHLMIVKFLKNKKLNHNVKIPKSMSNRFSSQT